MMRSGGVDSVEVVIEVKAYTDIRDLSSCEDLSFVDPWGSFHAGLVCWVDKVSIVAWHSESIETFHFHGVNEWSEEAG